MTSGGSLANLTALFCARNKALLARGVSRSGLVEQGFWRSLQTTGAQRAVILVSRLAHYSVRKSAAVLGLGSDDIVVLEQDEQQRANVSALTRIVEQCRAENTLIIAMIGIAGATETGTVDPLNDMASVCEQHGIHFHVDAAWGGGFMFSAQYRHKLRGIERADSITLCGHKQLFVAQGLRFAAKKQPRCFCHCNPCGVSVATGQSIWGGLRWKAPRCECGAATPVSFAGRARIRSADRRQHGKNRFYA